MEKSWVENLMERNVGGEKCFFKLEKIVSKNNNKTINAILFSTQRYRQHNNDKKNQDINRSKVEHNRLPVSPVLIIDILIARPF